MKRFQFVWWWGWPGLHFGRWPKDSSMALIYDWHLFIGWLEIRKWHRLTDEEKTRRCSQSVTGSIKTRLARSGDD